MPAEIEWFGEALQHGNVEAGVIAIPDGSPPSKNPRYSARQRQSDDMAEYCDKCGTELDPSQARHQQYQIEHASDSIETLAGRLCSDCFWEFKEWLQTEEVT